MPDPVFHNLLEFLRLLAEKSPLVNMQEFEGYRTIQCASSSWPNYAYDLSSPLDSETLDRIAQAHRDVHPNIHLLVDDLNPTEEELLLSKGFLHAARAFKVNLAPIPFPAGKIKDQSVEIKVVRTLDDLNIWVALASEGFGALDAHILEPLLRHPSSILLLALEGDEPVGSVMSFTRNKTAGQYFVYVRKQFRKRGIASLLMHELLMRTKAMGAEQAVFQAYDTSVGMLDQLNATRSGYMDLFWLPQQSTS